MVRLEWSPDGRFEDRPSLVFVNRRLPVPAFQVDKSNGLEIRTAGLDLHYQPGGDGKFTAGNLSIRLQVGGREVVWHPGDADRGNLQGTTRTLDRARGSRTMEPMGPGLVSRDGWVVVDDTDRPLFTSDDFTFRDGERSPWPWVAPRPAGARQDWYFFGYGHDYRAALGDYVRVAGRIPLPPRFAFGTWWSRYWAYSDQELRELVQGFRADHIPLDVLVIDMDWHRTFLDQASQNDASGHLKGWSGYSWNPALFPDPGQFLRELHADGLHVSLNLHPASGVQPWEDAYPAMAKAMGIDPATKHYVPFAITDPKFARNYFDLLHHPLERQGVDFWWLDWQQEANTAMAGVSPTWWLNYVHFTDQEREGKRPLLFHRWGGLGNHRYQIGFSGDTRSDWESLAFQPWFTATAANVGYAYWSHDIGGHISAQEDPELYTRWIQFGAYSPILRTHTTKNALSERRIWAFPEPYSDLMRSAFQLRHAMEPYLYTEGRRTYDTGVAFVRPLYYDWPEEGGAYAARGEYGFGDELVVAPAVAPVDPATGLLREDVWVPPGEWIEWTSGAHLRGPATVVRSFAVDEIPVYSRPGAIVPYQEADGCRVLKVLPLAAGQSAKYSVYEDDGVAENYQRGVAAWTDVQAREEGDELVVTVAPVRGSFPGMRAERRYELQLPADWPPVQATAGDAEVKWHYEGNSLTTVVEVPRVAAASGVEIRVRREGGLAARRGELDGFPGKMARWREVYDALTNHWPGARSPDVVTAAMQAGERMSYHPEAMPRILAEFHSGESAAAEQARAAAAKDAALLHRVNALLDAR